MHRVGDGSTSWDFALADGDVAPDVSGQTTCGRVKNGLRARGHSGTAASAAQEAETSMVVVELRNGGRMRFPPSTPPALAYAILGAMR